MSDFDFQLLDPKLAAVWLPMDGQFGQDVGSNLFVDGDMEAPGTGAWSLAGSLMVKSTVDPHSGTQCINVTIAGAAQGIYQSIGAINRTFRTFGWASGDGGAAAPVVYLTATPGWTGLSSSVWQYYDFVGVCSGVTRPFLAGSAAGVVRYDDVFAYEHPRVTRSIAGLSNALDYASMGDGHTASTFPTQLPIRGLRFDGLSNYVSVPWSVGSALDTTSFTFLLYGRPKTPPNSAVRLYEIGTTNARYVFYWLLSDKTLRFLIDGASDLELVSSVGFPDGACHVYAVTIDSTGCNVYVDDAVQVSFGGDVRLPALSPSTLAAIGAFPQTPGSTNYYGDIYTSAIYPFALSAAQIREWGRRARQLRTIHG